MKENKKHDVYMSKYSCLYSAGVKRIFGENRVVITGNNWNKDAKVPDIVSVVFPLNIDCIKEFDKIGYIINAI